MQTIKQLDLGELPMESAAFSADPFPFLEAAREKHPWLATCSFGYVVHQYEAMRELLLMDDKMRSAYESIVQVLGAHGTPWGRFQEESLLAYQGADHSRVREIIAPAFTPRQANKARGLMRGVISAMLDTWVPRRAFDFEQFAAYFPITVFCSLIGAPPSAVPDMLSSLEALGQSMAMDPAKLPELQEAILWMEDFTRGLITARRAAPHGADEEDMLDILIPAMDAGGITERELLDLLMFLFVAGYDTSKNALTLLMHALIDKPEDYARCAVDAEYCRKVVEENFRFLTTATIPRLTTSDFEYRGAIIPAGEMLFFPVSIAGRDPEAMPEGDEFLPEREQTNRHIAFGRGMHMCLGQHIARAQLEEGLHLIAQRMRHPRRTGAVGWRPFFGVWGLHGLPIEFDPA